MAFAITEAIVNTYAGVTQALRFYPPPHSWIMAASTLAMGMKQVSAIRSTSEGNAGGSGAGSLGGGGESPASSMGSSSSAPMAETMQTSTPRQTPASVFEVHLHNVYDLNQAVDEFVIPRIKQRIADGVGV